MKHFKPYKITNLNQIFNGVSIDRFIETVNVVQAYN